MSTKQKLTHSPHPPQVYSEAFKRQVVAEFEQGLLTKANLKRKYGIAGNSCISRWCRKYGKLVHKSYPTIGRPMKDKEKQYLKELQKQLNEKEAELTAYRKFIEIAEKELNIKIVKKSGTKQSKK